MSIQKITIPLIIILVLVGTFFLLSKKPESFKDEQMDLSKLQVQPTQSANTDTENKVDVQAKTETIMDLKIEEIKVGTGAEVKSGDTVVMNYNGTLEDGKKFDSSYDRGQPFETQIGVGQVIEGWDKGVPGMKVGGKRKLTIPSSMAYGDSGIPGAIPPKATLIFEVELMGIK